MSAVTRRSSSTGIAGIDGRMSRPRSRSEHRQTRQRPVGGSRSPDPGAPAPAPGRARRSAPCERPDRRAAPPPGGPSGRGRASRARAVAPGTDGRRRAARARPTSWEWRPSSSSASSRSICVARCSSLSRPTSCRAGPWKTTSASGGPRQSSSAFRLSSTALSDGAERALSVSRWNSSRSSASGSTCSRYPGARVTRVSPSSCLRSAWI